MFRLPAYRGVMAAALALGALACSPQLESGPLDFPVDPDPGGKTDAFGRKLAGVASDYEAAALDEDALVADMQARRAAAWATVEKVLAPAPLLGLLDSADEHGEDVVLPGGEEIPKVPRFQTWYGVDDIKRMFQRLYSELPPNQRAVRADFTDDAIADAVEWNAQALDRSSRWPLERYLKYVRELGVCPADMSDDECARFVQEKVGGAVMGNARILYSPAVVDHILRNYSRVLECLDELDALDFSQQPEHEENFSLCFDTEFPVNGVLVKAQWDRADFGRDMPAFDTDADALSARLGGTAHWGEDGDRRVDPSPSDIFTIRLRNGDTYRMVGLHIMTKEVRHWQWITLWWSDVPDADFGADRPDTLAGPWRNYKMCVVDGFVERDLNPAGHYDDTAPSLAAVLRAIDQGDGAGPTWCSNPYIEHGRNNARTNCIGCHQHGGSTVAVDVDADGTLDPLDLDAVIEDEGHFPLTSRKQIRDVFPADYLYSINRVDDFSGMMASEVSFFDGSDRNMVQARIDHVLSLDGDADAGHQEFLARCATCHGETGEGNGWAPSLYNRVPNRDDASLVQTLILGRGDMPVWGDVLSDQQIADVLAFARATFGGD